MTRHGMVQPCAAGTQPAANLRVSIVIFDADKVAPSYAPRQQHRADAQRSGLSASIPALPERGCPIPDTSRKQKSP